MSKGTSTFHNPIGQVTQIVSETRGCLLGRDQIGSDHLLREDLGLDSLAMVDLMVAIEDAFSMQFDPVATDLEQVFMSIDSLADFLQNQTSR
ncbi:MAG: acyl carrier protein [Lentisphaerae bacterium]|jgi:acyl carrier protein|nr:acyl carrier protein [Lentisphaerota bacterium]MBT7055421.1 acyl carrier protein [Lentisphaerota bacterium]